jgi:hypothetical protein
MSLLRSVPGLAFGEIGVQRGVAVADVTEHLALELACPLGGQWRGRIVVGALTQGAQLLDDPV